MDADKDLYTSVGIAVLMKRERERERERDFFFKSTLISPFSISYFHTDIFNNPSMQLKCN